MPILAAILSSIIVISAVLLTPSILSSPRSTYAAGVGSPLCKLTVQNTDPSFQDLAPEITRRYQIAFNAACPVLIKRFAPRTDVANNVTVTFKSDPSFTTETTGNRIDIGSHYLRALPYEAVGIFIGELTYIIQNYSSPDPIWFPGGMAAYVRSIYGPKDDRNRNPSQAAVALAHADRWVSRGL